MGYTLVASFSEYSNTEINSCVRRLKNRNKIPFGRGCDREAANRIMGYHVTLCTWGKEKNSVFLPRVDAIRFLPFQFIVTGTRIAPGTEDSHLLVFDVKPGQNFDVMKSRVETAMQKKVDISKLHITLAVSKNAAEIYALNDWVNSIRRFPFEVTVDALNLYHIWDPVYLDRKIQ